MVRQIPEKELLAIEAVVRSYPGGVGIRRIAGELQQDLPRRTLQYRLKRLVAERRLVREGANRWAKYRIPSTGFGVAEERERYERQDETRNSVPRPPLSAVGAEIRDHVRGPVWSREAVGYRREFLESYRPNVSAYLSQEERARLWEIGRPMTAEQPAGSFARQILNRLLIDLSWNSSRLEGNTYSMLDTRRLIAFGEAAEGKARLETQMILNHKDAIKFLVVSADEVGFDRRTVLGLHALLAANLLADPEAAGRLRHIAVGIEGSAFYPAELPQVIEECFDQILATAGAIEDPFEQAFFAMVHLPYLQPFEDVNKRVSRLLANVPFIKANLTPLSFTEVPRDVYTEAVLGVYELNRVELLKDIFIWAYERSAARYRVVRQTIGEPDPFRMKYREELREVIGDVVRNRMGGKAALAHVRRWVRQEIEPSDAERFREVTEDELLGMHEGNFVRYWIRPSEFDAWQEIWMEGIDETR